MNTEEEIKTGMGWTHLSKTSAPNFCDSDGNVFLCRCPKCKSENYAMMVAHGQCAWCGFNLNKYIES